MNQIPDSNRRLVKGYILKVFKSLDYINLPQLIVKVCLLYFNPNVDEWSTIHCHQDIDIVNSMVSNRSNQTGNSVFLKNIVSSGIHCWKFKLKSYDGFVEIGIEPATTDHQTSICFGLSHVSDERTTYWCRFCFVEERGTMIEMKLDFSKKSLYFIRNGQFVKAIGIPQSTTKYRAGVTLSLTNNPVELIQYQHTYLYLKEKEKQTKKK